MFIIKDQRDGVKFGKRAYRPRALKLASRFIPNAAQPQLNSPLPRSAGEGKGEGFLAARKHRPPHLNPLPRSRGRGENNNNVFFYLNSPR